MLGFIYPLHPLEFEQTYGCCEEVKTMSLKHGFIKGLKIQILIHFIVLSLVCDIRGSH